MISTSLPRFEPPAARIVLLAKPAQRIRAAIPCVIGKDLIIEPAALSEYCIKPLEPRIYDFVVIAAAAAFADRVVLRKPRFCWRRELELVVPVSEPDFWNDTRIHAGLTETLDLLTGDVWDFHFCRSPETPAINPQRTLSLGGSSSVVIPFSDGLDSFAAAHLAARKNPEVSIIKVTTGRRSSSVAPSMHRVWIPFSKRHHGTRLRETSNRSRGFVFGVMAGIAAYLLEAEEIIIPESGQGSLGPWLIPVGNEAPEVRMHPFFTATMAHLLRLILGRYIPHRHPHLWMTKGETLRSLREQALEQGWWTTKSCPRGRKVCLRHKLIQCGVCANCLLRRQSVHAAGLDPRDETYFWQNLAAPTMCGAANPEGRATTPNDELQAMCGFYDLATLASLAGTASGKQRISSAAWELAAHENISVQDAEARLDRLLAAHAKEWHNFISAQPCQSFLRRWLEALQC